VNEAYQAGETTESASETAAAAPCDASSGSASADSPGGYLDAASGDELIGYSDADIDAILAAEDQLPEPRTRQEAAADTWDDTNSSQDGAPDTSADGASPSQSGAGIESLARNNEDEDGTPGPYEHQVDVHTMDGTDVTVTVEDLPAEARTVGDTTPTGIGRKPTGDEFIDMEGDDVGEGGLDRFLGKMTEDADDLHDAFGSVTETVHDLRLPGPVPGSGHAYEGQAVHEPMPSPEPGFSDLVGSAALVGVAMLTAFRYWIWNGRKGDRK
jgi:hypothetical protein